MQRRTRGINYNEEVAFEKKPQVRIETFHEFREVIDIQVQLHIPVLSSLLRSPIKSIGSKHLVWCGSVAGRIP